MHFRYGIRERMIYVFGGGTFDVNSKKEIAMKNAKTLLIVGVLGAAVAAPAVYAADQYPASDRTTQYRDKASSNSPEAWDARFLQESNQPGGVGG